MMVTSVLKYRPDPPPPGFVRSQKTVMGNGVHRSGWPYALAALTNWEPPMLFDDFVEQTFVVQGSDLLHDIPWCGVFHYPPNMPGFCRDRMRPEWMIKSQRFRRSAPNLHLAIALTDYLANWLAEQLGVKVGVARLPTEPPTMYWSESAYDNNPTPMLIQAQDDRPDCQASGQGRSRPLIRV